MWCTRQLQLSRPRKTRVLLGKAGTSPFALAEAEQSYQYRQQGHQCPVLLGYHTLHSVKILTPHGVASQQNTPQAPTHLHQPASAAF